MQPKWWEQAIIYQIYPKSFNDSNADGIGDIQGIISKLDYLSDLGVNTLWLNPIFSSPQIDNGYDVDDYFTIDSIFGTMQDVEQLIFEAHQRNLKVIFDFVLNHTSSRHPWFQQALADVHSPYNDYYYFVDEKPNNWASFFGGSVWEPTADGRYYFHLFDKEMPDLNWTNAKLRQEMLEIAKFWCRKGIDGLRLDAFIHLGKADFTKLKEPITEDTLLAEEYYANLPIVHQYMKEFSTKLKAEFPDLFLVGEASSAEIDQAINYMHPDRCECDSVITFRYFKDFDKPKYPQLDSRFQPKIFDWSYFAETMDEWQMKMGQIGLPTLYWNNHDMPRMLNRLGDLNFRVASQKCLATLMYLQKGLPILLYGEEIGMCNHHAKSVADIEELEGRLFYKQARKYGLSQTEALSLIENQTRNASRGAMQWNADTYAGFSSVTPWLGVNVENEYNVEVESQDEHSILNYYKRLLQLKKTKLFTYGSYQRIDSPVYAYQRIYQNTKATIYCNLSNQLQSIKNNGQIMLAENVEKTNDNYVLKPWGSLVIKEEL